MSRLILLQLTLALCLVAKAHAAEFVVDTTDDTADAVPGDGTCADARGACSLRAAVMEANALAGADSVTLGAGSWHLVPGAPDDDRAAVGDLDVTEHLVIQGAGAAASAVEGAGVGRLVDVAPGVTLSLTGLTLRRGRLDQGGDGAGIRVGDGAILDLSSCEIRDCHVGWMFEDRPAGRGAALALGMAAQARLRDCDLSGNVADPANSSVGGAVWLGERSGLAALRTRFRLNVASDGGAIATSASATVELDRCELLENEAQQGMGSHVQPSGGAIALADGSLLTATASAFRGNGAVRAGGIFAEDGARIELEDCWLDGNRAADTSPNRLSTAGAVLVGPGGLRAVRCSFTGNFGGEGRGGAIEAEGPVELENCTFHGNGLATGSGLATGDGAALAARGGGRLVHCTVAGNGRGASSGSQVWQDGPELVLAGCLVALGRLDEPANVSGDSLALEGSNLIDWLDSTAGLSGSLAGLVTSVGPASSALAVLVDVAADNGGLVPTCALLPGSPAVDAGLADCADLLGQPLVTDGRGVARPLDGDGDGGAACDLGAFELDGAVDTDGDGVTDAGDCAPRDPAVSDLPAEVAALRAVRGALPGDLVLSWDGGSAGSSTFDVASASIASLDDGSDGALGADGPCVRFRLAGSTVTLSLPDSDSYCIVRGRNECGVATDGGWGADSLGAPRPACP